MNAKAFRDGVADRAAGLQESPNRHGWSATEARMEYYRGWDKGTPFQPPLPLVQGELFDV